MNNKSTNKTHAGYAALVGRPNVGKSTLLNKLLGEKVSIVSRRPQTTRNRIIGILTKNENQIVFVDTPGIHQRRANLNHFMVQEAIEGLSGVDCVLLVTEVSPALAQASQKTAGTEEIDVAKLHPQDEFVLQEIKRHAPHAPLIVLINKIDRLKNKSLLLPLISLWQEQGFETIIPISAQNGDGVTQLLENIHPFLPEGPHLYPSDMYTDQAERFLAAELIREQVFRRCGEEIPYSTAIEVIRFYERPKEKDICIEAIIHIERDSQKAILIGKHASMIKEIGMASRQEIGKVLRCPVHLNLTVHVEKDWSRSPAGRYKLGYEK